MTVRFGFFFSFPTHIEIVCLQQKKTILYEVEVSPGATHLANTKDYIHYSEEVDNYASIHIRNSMFAPLIGPHDNPVGVIQMNNKVNNMCFTEQDVKTFTFMA